MVREATGLTQNARKVSDLPACALLGMRKPSWSQTSHTSTSACAAACITSVKKRSYASSTNTKVPYLWLTGWRVSACIF